MKTILVFVSLAVTCNATCTGVKKAFELYKLVPNLVTVPPERLAKVTFIHKSKPIEVCLGTMLSPLKTFKYEADAGALYTLMKVDPDLPFRTFLELRHWLVVNIPESNVDRGDEVASYLFDTPPPFTGYHRYTFMVYKQHSGKIMPNFFTEMRVGFNGTVERVAKKYDLGDPIFGNFYQSDIPAPFNITINE